MNQSCKLIATNTTELLNMETDLLHETNTYISKNTNGEVKFLLCAFTWKFENQFF